MVEKVSEGERVYFAIEGVSPNLKGTSLRERRERNEVL